MSLFGGETSATSATSDSFSRDASPFTQSDSEPLQAVQIDGSSSVPSHKPKAEDDADDGDIELLDAPDDSGSSDYEPDRPNRFVGPPQTWRRYTVAERQLAASMEQVLAGDLAAHLYNAHVPKRELRPKSLPGLKNWHSKSRWYKENNELRKEGPRIERDPDFLPWKGWTLWPLPDAPRLRERFGVENGEDGEDGMIGGTHNASAGDDLRNVLLGTFQRFAKEQWQARPPADSDDEDTKTGMESETDTEAEANVKQESRSRSRSTTRRSRKRSIKTRSPSRSNTRAQSRAASRGGSRETSPIDLATELDDDVVHTTEVKIQSDVETSEASEGTKKRRVRRRMRKGTYFGGGPLSRPVVLADDEKARRILQPTVNSLLSKVDKLLEVLRRSNQNHWVVRGPPDTEMESDGDTISRGTSPSRSSSRLRKPSTTQDRGPSSRPQDEFKSTKGRNPFDKPLKRNGRNPLRNLSNPASGSESDYPPGDSGDAEDEDGQEDSQPRSKRRRTNRQHDLKPRDWSEVLGLASMTGWDPAVIDRAAKRCSALFGESMDFRTLQEGDSLKAPEDPIAYTPNLTLAPQTSNPNDGGILEDSSSLAEPRPYWPPGTQSCPHTDCWGNKQQFKMPYRAIEHCIRVHKYDPRVEKREASPMLGAVHVDGFLQPIHKQHGWRGGDAGDSEKRLKHAQKRSAQKTWDVNESEYRASRRLARKRESG